MPNATRAQSPDLTTDPPTRRVMDSLRRIVRALSASAHGPAARRRATGAQLFVLRQIDSATGLTIGELATRTMSGQSTVSEVVSRLVKRGLVARRPSPTDARQTRLAITARGRTLVRDVAPTAQERLAAGLEALDAEERDRLAHGLERWLEAAGLTELPATMFFERDGVTSRADAGAAR